MGRGRKATPTHLKILRGNPGHRPINKREPQPPKGAPQCPRWLSAEAKAEWHRIVPVLNQLQLMTKIDGTALGAYCQAHAELATATKILDDEGRLIKSPWKNKAGFVILSADNKTPLGYDMRVHPMVRLQRDAFTRVKQFLGEFGLTPASRTRLQTPPAEASEEDPLDTLLKRANNKNKTG